MIKRGTKAFKAAVKAIAAMHEFWKHSPQRGAVQWIEDSEGSVIIFTRGEYRDRIMSVVGANSDTEFFELQGKDGE